MVDPLLLATFGLTDDFDYDHLSRWEVIGLIVKVSKERHSYQPDPLQPFFLVSLPKTTLEVLGLKGDNFCITLVGDRYLNMLNVDVQSLIKTSADSELNPRSEIVKPTTSLREFLNSMQSRFNEAGRVEFVPGGKEFFYRWLSSTVEKLELAQVTSTGQFLSLSRSADFAILISKLESGRVRHLRDFLLHVGSHECIDSVVVLDQWFTSWEKEVINSICIDGVHTLDTTDHNLYDNLRRKIRLRLNDNKVSVTENNLPKFRRFFKALY